uniref:GPCR family 3 nine cysteines domain-containing protein n=1 Tax=Timema monikensis TaxID=170555 RepID=A0A7R9E2R0_9NEOP|nr:unnamed protein product [Timema monikensis]
MNVTPDFCSPVPGFCTPARYYRSPVSGFYFPASILCSPNRGLCSPVPGLDSPARISCSPTHDFCYSAPDTSYLVPGICSPARYFRYPLPFYDSLLMASVLLLLYYVYLLMASVPMFLASVLPLLFYVPLLMASVLISLQFTLLVLSLWKRLFKLLIVSIGKGISLNQIQQQRSIAMVMIVMLPGRERLSDRYKPDPKLSFIIKALYTMAYGLHNMLQDVCGQGGVCAELFPFNGSLFKSYLMNVTFTYGDEELVEFDRRGDPPGRYNIMNYQLLPNGSYDYIHVGDWNNGTLLMWDDLQYPRAEDRVESVCSKPCQPGYYKNLQTGGQEQKCCWVCVPCDRYEILVDDSTCIPCPAGYWPNLNKTCKLQLIRPLSGGILTQPQQDM